MFNCCSHGTLLQLQSSRFSLEYLLLPPRSAPAAAPGGLTPGTFNARRCDPPTHCGLIPIIKRSAAAAGGFRLPWPPSCCLEQPTPFMGSHERLASDALTRRLVHPTAPVLLTKSGPLGTLIQSSGLQSCKADFSPI
ncbi:uncharacterized protein CEXT_300601 [Caerostris extrusa]|uniref:Uncharacterized protein n=1 Tax=Caerostris extrusa TaxID=172846 RepID=A0AAV4Q342_CAEEX|nr:uncharacterized protein CEXT_300601 [Caerostris extrusa]